MKPNKSHVALVLATILFVASIAAIVAALTPTIPTYGQPGSMLKTANYLIGKDSTGLAYAVNGTTGAVDFSNANTSFVFQSAINARRGLGGSVYFSGNFTLTWGLTLYPSTLLESDGTLGAFSGHGTDSLNVGTSFAMPVITLQVDASHTSSVVFPNLQGFIINGAGAGSPYQQDGIKVISGAGVVFDVYITDVGVFKVGGNGLNVSSGATSKVWLDRFYAESNLRNGVLQAQDQGTLRLSNGYVYGNSYNGVQCGAICFVSDTWLNGNLQNGIRASSHSYATLTANRYDTNSLFGVDATSAYLAIISGSHFTANGQSAGADSGGAIYFWSNADGGTVNGNFFMLNGGSSNAAIRLRDPGGASATITVSGNSFFDTRGASAAKYFVYVSSGAVVGIISDNSFSGQISGNPAVSINNDTAHLLLTGNRGFNDVYGLITNPFWNKIGLAKLGLAGNASAPLASVTYTVYCVNQWIISSAGTGVSITVKDPAGNTVESGLTTLNGQFQVGYTIAFGAFSIAPTVTSYVL